MGGASRDPTANKIKQLVPDGDVPHHAACLTGSTVLEVSADGKEVRRPGLVRKSVTLGGKEYKGRDEVVTAARALIATGSAAEGGALPEEGQAFIKDLLGYHERSADKVGCGLASKVGRNPEHPDTNCFVLVPADATEADFSYLKCLDKIYPTPTPAHGKRKRGDSGSAQKRSRRRPRRWVRAGQDRVLQGPAGRLPPRHRREARRARRRLHVRGGRAGDAAASRASRRGAGPGGAVGRGPGQLAVLTGDDEKQYWEKIASGSGGGRGGGKGKGKEVKGQGRWKGQGRQTRRAPPVKPRTRPTGSERWWRRWLKAAAREWAVEQTACAAAVSPLVDPGGYKSCSLLSACPAWACHTHTYIQCGLPHGPGVWNGNAEAWADLLSRWIAHDGRERSGS